MVAQCLKLLAAGLILSSPLMAYASPEKAHPQVNQPTVDYLSQIALLKIEQLDQEIERCSHVAQSREITLHDVLDSLQSEYGREALVHGLGHLHFYNQLHCELPARQSLSYILMTLDNISDEETVIIDSIANYPRSLLYPSVQELTYELRYKELPSELTATLEATLGNKPFDLLRALDVNK